MFSLSTSLDRVVLHHPGRKTVVKGMETVAAILALMGQKMAETLTTPIFLAIYLLLFVIVAWQYKRIEDMSGRLLETTRRSFVGSAVASTFLGLAGGMLGSVLLVLVGIDLYRVGIMQMWVLALLLMLINPRFICFAYAGGLLSLLSLMVGYPDIDIPQLMGLVAILHIVESILIMANGHLNPVPIYVKKAGQIRGGFNLQKFWPIPLVALVSAGYTEIGSGVAMPEWWPLIKSYPGISGNQAYILIPVLAILGYGEISTTASPERKARESAFHLFIFSFVLLMLSMMASRWAPLVWVAALFSPLGHELVIWSGMRAESNRRPRYVSPPRGVMVLDVRPRTPAARAGLRSGDILVSINGMPINYKYELENALKWTWQSLQMQIQRGEEPLTLHLDRSVPGPAGIIAVPESFSSRYLLIREDSIFNAVRRWWRSLKK